MAKSLVIVESPAKAKTINKFLGSGYIVKPTGGHIIDLPPKEFGIDIDNGFKPKYTTIKGKGKILQDLKKAASGAESVFLATDPDREGEAIAWHVANNIVSDTTPVYRVLFNQITKNAVVGAMNHVGELDLKKVYAQQARRVLDRLVGYQVSPILWKAMYSGLSAGRVQSVALRLIVERDAEIEAFVPEEYWRIKALLATAAGETFEAGLLKKGGKNFKMGNEEEAKAAVADLEKASYAVSSVQEKKSKRNPSPPFITSTLQQEASRRLGFTVSRTMKVAQTLYEGVEIQEGSTGLITYMRTDSTRIAQEAIAEVRDYIDGKWGSSYVPGKPNFYRSKKGAQDAHEAIRPVSMDYDPVSIKRFLTADQFKLYSLIWNRFVASQMKPAELMLTTIDIAAGDYLFRTKASRVVYDGFLKVYADFKKAVSDDDNGDEDELLESLPKLEKDQQLDLNTLTPSQHFTKPPARYTEASLVRELESEGIGRPSTYAQIINTILSRKYVERQKGKLLSTELGRNVNTILVSEFPDLFNVDFTANMEEELDKVEAGEHAWDEVVGEFYEPFSTSLEKVKSRSGELKKSLIEETDEVCEKCGKPMIIRWGRNGRFMACSGFPACRNTKPLQEQAPVKTDEVCDKCGSPMEIKTGRYGRFMACSNYPDCKNIKPIKTGVPCPEKDCDGELLEKTTKRGRLFYGCSNYPKCSFASWTKPVAVACPSCGASSMTEGRNGKLVCPLCKDSFDREEVGEESSVKP